MPKTEPSSDVNPRRSLFSLPRFQFSLAWLMIAVSVVAVVLFLATRLSDVFELVILSIVTCIVPTPLVICAIFGRGDVRAFSIGAMIPWAATLAFRIPGSPSSVFGVIWILTMGGSCGVIAVVTRRWVQRNSVP